MLNWLDRLRDKPKMVRNQYAFAGASVFTAVVALLWLAAAPLSTVSEIEVSTDAAPTGAFGHFISSVKDQVASSFAALEYTATSSVDRKEEEQVEKTTSPVSIPQLSATNTAVRQVRSRPIIIATSSNQIAPESN